MGQERGDFRTGGAATASSTGRSLRGDKAATQARILRSAMRLFASDGYDGATIAAIAQDAGVSRATVFWHFTDKANLFAEAMREMLVPFVRALEKRALEFEDPKAVMLELIEVYEAFVEKNRDTIETFVRWVLESPRLRDELQGQLFALHNRFARDIRDALARALGDPKEAAALAAALMALLDGTLLLSFLDPDRQAQQLRRQGLRQIAARLFGGRYPA